MLSARLGCCPRHPPKEKKGGGSCALRHSHTKQNSFCLPSEKKQMIVLSSQGVIGTSRLGHDPKKVRQGRKQSTEKSPLSENIWLHACTCTPSDRTTIPLAKVQWWLHAVWAISYMTLASPNSPCYPKTIKAAWHKVLPDHVSDVLVSIAQVPIPETMDKVCCKHEI